MNDMHQPDTQWEAFLEGDKTALSAIYAHYLPVIYDYGMRLHQDSALVEDCIQDLFIKLWVNREHIGKVSRVKPYLMVALRGAIYNKLKPQKVRRIISMGELPDFKMMFSEESAYLLKDARETRSRELIAALNQLSPRQKEIIYLRFYEELPYEDISAMMNISVKAAYKLSARALGALRDLLKISLFGLLLVMARHRLRMQQ